MMLAIVTVLPIVTAGSAATLAVVLRRQRGLQHLDAPQWVVERCGPPRLPSHGAIPVRQSPSIAAPPVPAIEAPVIHYHLHLHAAPAPQTIGIEESKLSD
jgi:hypothetical protein